MMHGAGPDNRFVITLSTGEKIRYHRAHSNTYKWGLMLGAGRDLWFSTRRELLMVQRRDYSGACIIARWYHKSPHR